MKIGIVGSEGAKFTPAMEARAKAAIWDLLYPDHQVVSGGCHLGGIDVWAEEIGIKMGIDPIIFRPARLQWEGGYKQRNLLIAKESDKVVCITVRSLPEGYKGMRFSSCYHCGTNDHVKSGGCWTMKQARLMGKPTQLIIIEAE